MDAFDLAMKNTLQFGDTDIFPVPYEYDFLREKSSKIKNCINSCSSISHETACSLHAKVRKSRGGYRTATLIDPLLHLEYLALAIEIAGIAKKNRVRKEDHIVHSYRFCPDETTGKLFDTQYGFTSFKSACQDKEKAGHPYKIELDVLDFYHSVDLSILETVLKQQGIDETLAARIITVIHRINNDENSGLPVGGNASRILAEILLNEFDQYCMNEGIDYVRFVDDVVVFSKGDEMKDLFAIHQKLSSLGFVLNYSKLQISECFEQSYQI